MIVGPVEISGARSFTLEEAQAILPVIFRITEGYKDRVADLVERIEKLGGHDPSVVSEIENQVNNLIAQWQLKLQKLGTQPKGLWIADFDAGDGFFCWKYPEAKIEFWHTYHDGFTKRILVSKRKAVPPPVAENPIQL
jgi:hypothetical protein